MVSVALEPVLQPITNACIIVGMMYLVTYTRYYYALVTCHFTLQNHAIFVLVSVVVPMFSGHEMAETLMRGED